FPFSQGQPLIRYRTRDLVTREVCACGRSDSFQFHGRDINTVLAPGESRALLTPIEVTDAWYDHLLGSDLNLDPDALHLAAVVPDFRAVPGGEPRARLTRSGTWPQAGPDGTKRIDAFLGWITDTAAERGVALDIVD